jgi:Myb-like DNA-binding protein FlbD
VKNWWNGGQNRRKRNPERGEHRGHEQSHASQPPYHFPGPLPHPAEPARAPQPSLPRLRDYPETSPYYSQSRRPSLNPTATSPRALKLPQPQGYEHYSGSRPQPLELSSYPSYSNSRSRGYETPMPSPGYSVASVEAPSLVTDTGSESRSPRGAPSPLEHGLPPMIGSRQERKNSSTRYLPVSGFAVEDDDQSTQFDYRRRPSIQLPPLQRSDSKGATPVFREPNYRSEKPQLLTQPAPQLVHHHSMPHPAPAPGGQLPLPSYQNLSLPNPQASSPATTSPASRQLPSPFARPAQVGESRSAPTSPNESPRDERMKLNHIL